MMTTTEFDVFVARVADGEADPGTEGLDVTEAALLGAELREGGGETLPVTLRVAVELEDGDPDDDADDDALELGDGVRVSEREGRAVRVRDCVPVLGGVPDRVAVRVRVLGAVLDTDGLTLGEGVADAVRVKVGERVRVLEALSVSETEDEREALAEALIGGDALDDKVVDSVGDALGVTLDDEERESVVLSDPLEECEGADETVESGVAPSDRDAEGV